MARRRKYVEPFTARGRGLIFCTVLVYDLARSWLAAAPAGRLNIVGDLPCGQKT
jgi:hypothetical protein